MIFTLSILIDLCLIVAAWAVLREQKRDFWRFRVTAAHHLSEQLTDLQRQARKAVARLEGRGTSVVLRSKLAEKMADRAFNMASSANLGVIALQKSLARPVLLTKTQATANQLASNEVDKLFSSNGRFDYLRPLMTDEEIEIIEKLEAENMKNGTQT